MAFSGVSDLLIEGNAVNVVQGDQSNQHITGEIIHIHGSGVVKHERTEYDEFEEVKRGHIYMLKEIDMPSAVQWDWREGVALSARRTAHIAEIMHGHRKSKFTVVTYRGKDAEKVWKRDFDNLSQNEGIGNVQLFGLNRSSIPSLIFYDELIPLKQVYQRDQFWQSVYLVLLASHSSCNANELWLNSKLMRFCVGPEGPYSLVPSSYKMRQSIGMSSEAAFLKDSVAFRYLTLQGAQKDKDVLKVASWLKNLLPGQVDSGINSLWGTHPLSFKYNTSMDELDDVLQKLRFDTIYSSGGKDIARCLGTHPSGTKICALEWDEQHDSTLIRVTVVGANLISTGFLPIGCPTEAAEYLYFSSWPLTLKAQLKQPWLSQSTSILRCIAEANITAVEEEDCTIVKPMRIVWLRPLPILQPLRYPRLGDNSPILPPMAGKDGTRPVYLLIHLPSEICTMADLVSWANGKTHYWSYTESGDTEIPRSERDRMGLPEKINFHVSLACYTWPKHVYEAMRKWQTARGFDPNTTDFARHLGYEAFEILATKDEQPRKEKPAWWQVDEDADFSAFAL
ncbi:hypothetical protein VNI00_004291 [Paramarasmius palmivorus]|uniref:Uncharacterized protein n=1 Tax=Paramarasmius palmivorus TaxID=297713 RepID=A0AAW0DK99_9AGAR